MLANGRAPRPTVRPRHPTVRPAAPRVVAGLPGCRAVGPNRGPKFYELAPEVIKQGALLMSYGRFWATDRFPTASTAGSSPLPHPANSGPTYRADGRMIFPSPACSSTCAVQPIVRASAKVGVNISGGMPHCSITTAA